MTFDYVVDVVVVGSGSAAATAALAVKEHGHEPLVLESTELFGGSSSMSGGGLWVPDNSVLREAGVPDSYALARTYMDEVIGDVGPASSPQRRHAFLTQGPAMVDFLRGLGMRFVHARDYADYYPERPGGLAVGRGIEGVRWDVRKLGPWRGRLRGEVPLPVHTSEVAKMLVSLRTLDGFLTAANVVGVQTVGASLLGKRLRGLGNSLMGQLLYLLVERSVPIWLSSPMTELITQDGAVVGAVVDHDGRRMRVGARHGVILAAGGFAQDDAMRQQYHPHPIGTAWTSANPGDRGDAVKAGMALGAAVALMDDAWWGPSVIGPDGKAMFLLGERSLPHGFVVDSSGQRFMNESESYVDAGHHQYARHAVVDAIPAFLVIDSRHRRRYPFGLALPGITPKKFLESGFMVKADTLDELAVAIGVDPVGLLDTAARFATFAQTGVDEDFGRGASAYDRVYSDPRVRPNPNLGAVSRPPFYAVRVWPGDLGTKGGLLTDEHARVLREDGSVIAGLYAAGNTSASVMGNTYPGPGSTIGPAMTFGYVAGRHAAAGTVTGATGETSADAVQR
ncbi:FAD-binding protein [Cellulomonas soli]|uniref:3-oxosteroid 1-dehydrogenase n=1 Tax=Cellulomonas soli TaxID=931535 RepID=A0A512P8G5_9CELL|nr:FAD-binding protein [Cellulomonas soli]NYI57710.1 3-oxosteroid 1-dehydrogenase [Cellulomonas soli]GEP67491.1 3-oxosteroid 1-dehydrogenase [Cellulomonas soli]